MTYNECDLAYLAGAIDSDGYITVKKSTYHKRVRGDATNAVFSEKMGLHQVTPQIPSLLKECFGGYMALSQSKHANRKDMYRWTATDKLAAEACRLLLPYLRVKRRQAELALDIRETKRGKYATFSYWFLRDHPDWQAMELVSARQVKEILGYSAACMISQAVKNGTLVGLPYERIGVETPRFPRLLVQTVADSRVDPDGMRRHGRPKELLEWRERIWADVRELNKMGINGTPVYHRTGCYEPL